MKDQEKKISDKNYEEIMLESIREANKEQAKMMKDQKGLQEYKKSCKNTFSLSKPNKDQDTIWVSANCECHIQEPYGFVPEADCKEHDTNVFLKFLKEYTKSELEKIRDELESKKKLMNEISLLDLIKHKLNPTNN